MRLSTKRPRASGRPNIVTVTAWVAATVAIALGAVWSIPSVVAVNELRSSTDAMWVHHSGFLDALESAVSDQETTDRVLRDRVRAAEQAWAAFDAEVVSWGMNLQAERIYRIWTSSGHTVTVRGHEEYNAYKSALSKVATAKGSAEDAADDVLLAQVVATASTGALATFTQKLAEAEGDMILRLSVAGATAALAVLGAVIISVLRRRKSDLPVNEPSPDTVTQAQTPVNQAAS